MNTQTWTAPVLEELDIAKDTMGTTLAGYADDRGHDDGTLS